MSVWQLALAVAAIWIVVAWRAVVAYRAMKKRIEGKAEASVRELGAYSSESLQKLRIECAENLRTADSEMSAATEKLRAEMDEYRRGFDEWEAAWSGIVSDMARASRRGLSNAERREFMRRIEQAPRVADITQKARQKAMGVT